MNFSFSVYTNFFDGDDKRGKHTPSNKLSSDIVEGVVSLLDQYTVKNSKSKKRIINDPEIRSLRHLYTIYKNSHDDPSPSYTSFKRIFNDHCFAFPPDRLQRFKSHSEIAQIRNADINEVSFKNEDDCIEEQVIEEHLIEDSNILPELKESSSQEPKVIVTQVPDSSRFFANPSQVYEIQIIEIPVQSIIKHS